MLVVCLAFTPLMARGELSDSQVLDLINKGREKPLKPQDIKVIRPDDIPGVIVVAYSLGKDGYIVGTVILDGRPYSPVKAARMWLYKNGWQQAEGNERIRLAGRWLENVMLSPGERWVKEKPVGFESTRCEFVPPVSRVSEDGSVTIVVWIQENSGLLKVPSYRRTLYHFKADGTLTLVRMLEHCTARIGIK